MTSPGAVTWEVARAGAVTAYLLLMGAVALGLARSLPWKPPRWLRNLTTELHNVLALVALVFTGISLLAVILVIIVDSYTRFGLSEVFTRLAGHYWSRWMALGIVGLYLGLAVGLSTWLRPRVGDPLWRRLHLLTLVIFAVVTVYSLATSGPPGYYP